MSEKKADAIDALEDLEKMTDSMIADLSGIKGAEGIRQRHCYYREKVWTALEYLNRK